VAFVKNPTNFKYYLFFNGSNIITLYLASSFDAYMLHIYIILFLQLVLVLQVQILQGMKIR
jgi:hypothetical protein